MKPASAESRSRRRIALPGEQQDDLSQAISLSNGRYTVRLSGVGSGYSECAGVGISRWTPDETRDADGFHIYLRDLDTNFVWSAGYQPTCVAATQYAFHPQPGLAEIVRVDHGIECRLTVCVSAGDDFEVRRCELTNLENRSRRIELTSYLEWVLGNRMADASHPAFSKLFVETEFCAERGAILAKRRPRSSDDCEFWGCHTVVCGSLTDVRNELEFESNRARFIGRGRTLARPLALDPGETLSGDTGAVLDPIASLRMAIELPPSGSRQIAFVLGAAGSRLGIDDLLAAIGDFAQIERVLQEAAAQTGSAPNGGTMPDEASAANGDRLIVHSAHHASRQDAVTSVGERKYKRAASTLTDAQHPAIAKAEPLQFDNGYGGFSADGREYIIQLHGDGAGRHKRPPMPWANVVANEQAGFLVTESGAGYTWSGNSRSNRLTAWHNDPVCDPPSEAFWIRDEDARVFWSPMPGPTPAANDYLVRHGFGYTSFEHGSHDLAQEVTMFMARDEPVKIVKLRLANRSGRTRRLSLFSYLQWALGSQPGETTSEIATTYDPNHRAIWATNPNREHYTDYVAFSAVRAVDTTSRHVSHSCDRESFLGRYGDLDAPAAVAASAELDRRAGKGLDPCAAWQVKIELAPNGVFECAFLLGEAPDRDNAEKMLLKFSAADEVRRELIQVKEFWRDTLSAITVETPDRELDLMVNGWLLYQNIACRMWGRSAYYQPGGAFGYRDQLQDAAALLYHRPDMTRAQILRHAAQQFVEGDVLHWWHPDTGYGLRTRFSDDLIWLPYVVTQYIQMTGDDAILDESLPFITAAPLASGQQEAYLRPAPSDALGSLYDHCCHTLDRGLTTGSHGLPLIGCGDWNDGFSRIGRQGRGESVWLGFFIDYVLQRMLPICSQRGDDERVLQYTAYRDKLRAAINSAGWDGAWYRRAYYDNGEPLGSAAGSECQIDALAQAWAIISGVATPDRSAMSMDAVESRLIDEEAGIIRLLTPAFNHTPNDPGYIKGYLPGIRENGGQYTHGVLWVVKAMAELGRGTRAVELLKMLTPIAHTSTAQLVSVYQTEPYAVAADVYGEPPHVGRGGWTWYTGSAGWMFRVAVESIFGVTTERGRTLVINPSISSAWPQCRLTYRLPDGSRYEITIENPSGRERGVTAATVDDESADVENGIARIPLRRDQQMHNVVVRL